LKVCDFVILMYVCRLFSIEVGIRCVYVKLRLIMYRFSTAHPYTRKHH